MHGLFLLGLVELAFGHRVTVWIARGVLASGLAAFAVIGYLVLTEQL